MFVVLLFGVLYCATGQPYQRDWSADWDRVPNGIGGHVKYENGNFGFKGNGWVDKHKNWGVGASFNWRFRRSLQEMGLKKVGLKQSLYKLLRNPKNNAFKGLFAEDVFWSHLL